MLNKEHHVNQIQTAETQQLQMQIKGNISDEEEVTIGHVKVKKAFSCKRGFTKKIKKVRKTR